MEPNQHKHGTRRRRTRVVIYVVLLLDLSAFASMGYLAYFKTQSRLALRDVEARIREAGYPVTAEEMDAFYPSVPDKENAGLLYLEAQALLKQLDPGYEKTDSLFKAFWAEDGAPIIPASSELLASVEAHLQNCQAVFVLHDRAAPLPGAHYPVDWSDGLYAEMPHLSGLQAQARLQTLRGFSAAYVDDVGELVESQERSFALARSLYNEPATNSQLMRFRIIETASNALSHILGVTTLSPTAIETLKSGYAEVGNLNNLSRTLAAQRCAAFISLKAEDEDRTVKDRRQVIANEQYEAVLERMDQSWPVLVEEFPWRRMHPQADGLAEQVQSILSHVVNVFARGAATARMAETALAVEAYRADYGVLPDTLEVLPPTYLSAVPEDPFDGSSLRYVRQEHGYLLYSVYLDQKDDGGKEVKNIGPQRLGDWTFIVSRRDRQKSEGSN